MKNQSTTRSLVRALRILIVMLAGALMLNLGSTPMAHAGSVVAQQQTVVDRNYVSIGTGVDSGPQDGVFDYLDAGNLGSVSNNGWTSYRTAFEFSLSSLPVGWTINSIKLTMSLDNFDGTRAVQVHGYAGDGTVQLNDLSRDGLVGTASIDPSGAHTVILDVTSFVAGLVANGGTFAGFNIREAPANTSNFLIMRLGAMPYDPKLSITLQPPPTGPLTFNVNSFSDAVDLLPGDGLCKTATGVCTLRAAIQEANAHPGSDVIALRAGTYKLTIPGAYEFGSATGDLNITDSVTINGVRSDDDEAQTIIDGNGIVTGDRVFHITNGTVNISKVVIKNGRLLFDAAHPDPVGGGIANFGGTVTLVSVLITGNASDFGGGIHSQGTLLLQNSRVLNNTATCGRGGGITNRGTLTLINSTVDGNQATDPVGCLSAGNGAGGGIDNVNGVVSLQNSTVSNNTATGADGTGGGIRNRANNASSSALVNVTNSTISGNKSSGGGAGIWNRGTGSMGSTVNLSNATMTANKATDGVGGIRNRDGVVNAKNSIIAINFGSVGVGADCVGTFNSVGNNLIGTNDGCIGFTNGVNGDIVGTNTAPIDPRLSPLAMHGGNTRTHALRPKSPALDAGNACEPKDQRGVTRPQGPRCDIGSYERKTGGDSDN